MEAHYSSPLYAPSSPSASSNHSPAPENIWDRYEFVTVDGKVMAKCNICSKVLSRTTTRARAHYQNIHLNEKKVMRVLNTTTNVLASGTHRPIRDPIWAHFDIVQVENGLKAVCKYCHRHVSKTTTRARQHYRLNHGGSSPVHVVPSQEVSINSIVKTAVTIETPVDLTTTLKRVKTEPRPIKATSLQSKFETKLLDLSASTSLNLVSNICFAKLCHLLNPSITIPSSIDVSKTLISRVSSIERQICGEILQHLSKGLKLVIELDRWSVVFEEHISIFVHLKEKVRFLGVMTFDGNKSADLLKLDILAILYKYSIKEEDIFAYFGDGIGSTCGIHNFNCNESEEVGYLFENINNCGLISTEECDELNKFDRISYHNEEYDKITFGQSKRMHCFVKQINYMYGEIFKQQSLSLNLILKNLRSIKESHMMNAAFYELSQENIILPCQAKYSSIILALEYAVKHESSIKETITKFELKELSDTDWKDIKDLIDVLSPLKIILNNLQSSKTSISSVIAELKKLKYHIQISVDAIENTSSNKSMLLYKFQVFFDRIFDEYSLLSNGLEYFIATFLDSDLNHYLEKEETEYIINHLASTLKNEVKADTDRIDLNDSNHQHNISKQEKDAQSIMDQYTRSLKRKKLEVWNSDETTNTIRLTDFYQNSTSLYGDAKKYQENFSYIPSFSRKIERCLEMSEFKLKGTKCSNEILQAKLMFKYNEF
uniref:BED-type domain-containing protein n=1 Tax=Rhabditophanes sp. KR3021 TaxID=114890 RepID=A0AC35UDX7_9BILA